MDIGPRIESYDTIVIPAPAKAGAGIHYSESRMIKQPVVYIMASKRNGTLYIGVTSDLVKRVYEHKHGITGGFTSKYNVHNLVYYELFENMDSAITREKQMKKWRRAWKIQLIEKDNPDWRDLWPELIE